MFALPPPLLGGAATVLPQLGSLVFKLSADSLALNNADPVSSWVDSINGAAATQGTGANQPTFRTNLFGGKPGVRFDGTNDVLQLGRPAALTAAIDSQTYTAVVVCRVLSAKGFGTVFGASAGGSSFMLLADGTEMGRFHGGVTRCAPTAGNGFFVQGTTSITPYARGSGTGLERGYLQGGCYMSFVAQAPGSGGNNFAIGSLTGGAFPANVEVFEILVWNSHLTPTEMFQVQKWACDKYGQAYPWAAASRIVVYDGNSLTAGSGASGTTTTYPYKSAQALGLAYGQWTVAAVGGITVANMQANVPDWSGVGAMTGKPMRVAAFEYYNSRGLGEPAVHNNTNAYAAAVRAIANTKLCLGTSLSNSADVSATRDAFNAYYDANSATHCDSYVALHLDASIGTNTAYTTNGGPAGANPDGRGLNLWSDQVHLNSAGYTALEPLMTAGLVAIP